MVEVGQVLVAPACAFVGLELRQRDERHRKSVQLSRYSVRVTIGETHPVDAGLNLDTIRSDTHADDAVGSKKKLWT